jgi:PAS domain-containing protein
MKKLILFLLLLATAAHAETYKWTDSAGTVHFSEFLAEVPASYRKSARPLGISTSAASPAATSGSTKSSNDFSGVDALKERMLQDQGVMEQIRALQHDPEMQALLSNPDIIRAVQSGDYSVLVTNPAFLRLLNNPRVQEIGKRMQ